MVRYLKRLWRDESGGTAVEYALIVGIVGVGIIVVLGALRDNIVSKLQEAADALAPAP